MQNRAILGVETTYMTEQVQRKEQNGMKGETLDTVSADLQFINQSFAFGFDGLSNNEKSHQKKSVFDKTLSSLLQPYLSAGVRFRSSVVRILNFLYENKIYNDQQIIDDVEVRLHEQEKNINEKVEKTFSLFEKKLAELEAKSLALESTFVQVDSVTRGLESLLKGAGVSRNDNSSLEKSEAILDLLKTDNSYILLENRYRGSEELITDRMKPYVSRIKEYIQETTKAGPVLEVGCGRGELLSLLHEEGIDVLGIEPDEAMVRRCREKGLQVYSQDIVEYLSTVEDASIKGIVAIQVIEHLSNDYRTAFLELLMRKVIPGGFLILETINTSSFLPLLQNYFRDPTHVFPLHPDTLRTVLEQAGLEVRDVLYSSEYPEEAKIPYLPPPEGMTFRQQEFSKQINERLEILNRLIFGSQDYTIIAKVPL